MVRPGASRPPPPRSDATGNLNGGFFPFLFDLKFLIEHLKFSVSVYTLYYLCKFKIWNIYLNWKLCSYLFPQIFPKF